MRKFLSANGLVPHFAGLIFLLAFSLSSFAFTNTHSFRTGKKSLHTESLFQLSGGFVYSSIDLSRYTNTNPYRGIHARLVTHLGGLFFLSTEYSTFPVHESPSAWSDVHTRKFDVNCHVSFATSNKRTRIFTLAGVNRHEWIGRRTGFTDLDQLAKGLPEGTYVSVNRMGVNFGCGFTQLLYENIGLFGDFRFCFGNANNFEKVRIMDVMTTIGINFSIPYPNRTIRAKTFGTGKKIYKWTEKGAR